MSEPNDGIDERMVERCPACGATDPNDCFCDDDDCIRDDSTECDCPSCTGAEDRFWAEQGEGAEQLETEHEDREP